MNKIKLVNMCHGKNKEKTKTKLVLQRVSLDDYVRQPLSSVFNKTKFKARVQIMCMFGMLKCARNFKHGHGGDRCSTCNKTDDENHRINDCIRYKEVNLFSSTIKYDFNCIFSFQEDEISRTIEVVEHVWNLEHGKNEMRCLDQ